MHLSDLTYLSPAILWLDIYIAAMQLNHNSLTVGYLRRVLDGEALDAFSSSVGGGW